MFFIFGITNGYKEIEYNCSELKICKSCGAYCRYDVFMTYMCLSIFFIPTIKWGKKFYIKTSCCGSLYELKNDVGKRIARGENTTIDDEDIAIIKENRGRKICKMCGFETDDNFIYCPKCGKMF